MFIFTSTFIFIFNILSGKLFWTVGSKEVFSEYLVIVIVVCCLMSHSLLISFLLKKKKSYSLRLINEVFVVWFSQKRWFNFVWTITYAKCLERKVLSRILFFFSLQMLNKICFWFFGDADCYKALEGIWTAANFLFILPSYLFILFLVTPLFKVQEFYMRHCSWIVVLVLCCEYVLVSVVSTRSCQSWNIIYI